GRRRSFEAPECAKSSSRTRRCPATAPRRSSCSTSSPPSRSGRSSRCTSTSSSRKASSGTSTPSTSGESSSARSSRCDWLRQSRGSRAMSSSTRPPPRCSCGSGNCAQGTDWELSVLEIHEPEGAYEHIGSWLPPQVFSPPGGEPLVAALYLGYGLSSTIRRTSGHAPPEPCPLP